MEFLTLLVKAQVEESPPEVKVGVLTPFHPPPEYAPGPATNMIILIRALEYELFAPKLASLVQTPSNLPWKEPVSCSFWQLQGSKAEG